jgi:excinuclease ABC subunit C
MCLAPCYQGCTDARYAEEADAVHSFLATRGESKLIAIRTQRDQASEQLEFESAARLHVQLEKIEAVRALAPELVRPLSSLRACLLQTSANPDEICVYLYEAGELRGPAAFSTLGMRIQNEQSGSSSLYAQPLAVQPVPEAESPSAIKATRDALESRMEAALVSLSLPRPQPSATTRQGHLALLARWYYRPQQKRAGEICFPSENEGGSLRWPLKSMLRSVGRVAASNLH